MAQRDNRHSGRYFGLMRSSDCQRYALLSGEAKYPAVARPSKCITIITIVIVIVIIIIR
jgi:hypothetical protein